MNEHHDKGVRDGLSEWLISMFTVIESTIDSNGFADDIARFRKAKNTMYYSLGLGSDLHEHSMDTEVDHL